MTVKDINPGARRKIAGFLAIFGIIVFYGLLLISDSAVDFNRAEWIKYGIMFVAILFISVSLLGFSVLTDERDFCEICKKEIVRGFDIYTRDRFNKKDYHYLCYSKGENNG